MFSEVELNRFADFRVHAKHIATSALEACSVGHAVNKTMRGETGTLFVEEQAYAVRNYRQITMIAAGKAAEAMLNTVYAVVRPLMPPGIPLISICVSATVESLPPGTEWFQGGHPLPVETSLAAGRRILQLLSQFGEKDLVLFLLSGGASAMLELPTEGIDLGALRQTYSALVGCGANIAEVNCIRKRISRTKGGGLARAASPATQITLLVSDIAPGEQSALAAGPTLPDDSSITEAARIINTYKLSASLPSIVLDRLQLEREWTNQFPRHTQVVTILDSSTLAAASTHSAQQAGWISIVDPSYAEGEASEVMERLLSQLEMQRGTHRRASPPICLISCGEANVILPSVVGRGGRNQHLALMLAQRCAGLRIGGLCCATDGVDGNSDAAGAFWDGTTSERAAAAGLDVASALSSFNSESFFAALGDSLITGPTGNNLRDLRLIFSF